MSLALKYKYTWEYVYILQLRRHIVTSNSFLVKAISKNTSCRMDVATFRILVSWVVETRTSKFPANLKVQQDREE